MAALNMMFKKILNSPLTFTGKQLPYNRPNVLYSTIEAKSNNQIQSYTLDGKRALP